LWKYTWPEDYEKEQQDLEREPEVHFNLGSYALSIYQPILQLKL
jgi:hypothetical protein